MTVKDEFVYTFSGFHGTPSRCHIRVLDDEDKPLVVICSQMASKPGTSVTNAAEIIAPDIRAFLERDNATLLSAIHTYIKKSLFTKMLDDLVRRLKESRNPTIFAIESIKLALEYRERQLQKTGKVNGLLWIEHYAPGLGLTQDGSYAIVTFNKDSWTPSWSYITPSELALRTGYPKTDLDVPISALSGA